MDEEAGGSEVKEFSGLPGARNLPRCPAVPRVLWARLSFCSNLDLTTD